MRTLIAASLVLVLAGGATLAQWNTTTMPLGGGWSSTQFQDSQVGAPTCTTMPMGGRWASTTSN